MQRVYEKRICTSLPSSLRITWNGVLKPRHFLGVRLTVRTISWISSSVEELFVVLQDALSHVCNVRLRQYLVNNLVREERATVRHGTTLHDGEDRTHNLAAHLLASLAWSNNVKLNTIRG